MTPILMLTHTITPITGYNPKQMLAPIGANICLTPRDNSNEVLAITAEHDNDNCEIITSDQMLTRNNDRNGFKKRSNNNNSNNTSNNIS